MAGEGERVYVGGVARGDVASGSRPARLGSLKNRAAVARMVRSNACAHRVGLHFQGVEEVAAVRGSL